MRLPATLFSRGSRSQDLGSAIGRDTRIRAFKKDCFLIGSSRERSFLGYNFNRFSSLAPPRLMNYRFLFAPRVVFYLLAFSFPNDRLLVL